MNKKVLAIDDSRIWRRIVTQYLKPFRVDVVEAENGHAGLIMAHREKPDLILLDYNMPVMDGYHTLAELKTDPSLKSIPVVMLTTETGKETVLKLIKFGLKDYLAKPFTRELLLQKLNSLLGLYEGDIAPSETALEEVDQTAVPEGKTSVLAVDDKPNVLRLLEEYLGDAFYVETAQTGRDALEKLSRCSFDWLFLDLDLPDMSCRRVDEAFRKSCGNSSNRKRVIGISRRTAEEEIREARSHGIHALLFKPFTRAAVLKLVREEAQPEPDRDAVEVKFFMSRGDVRILACPDATHPKFDGFALALSNEILANIEEMADEGLMHLLIKLTPGVISNLSIAKRFIRLLSRAQTLGLMVKVVIEKEKMRDWLSCYSETEDLPVFDSMESALKACELSASVAPYG